MGRQPRCAGLRRGCWKAGLILAVALVQAGRAGAQAPHGTDLAYFDDAAEGLPAAVKGVVMVVVSHPRKPSRGFKRLPFQPKPDPDADPVIDCEDLEPAPRAVREDAPESFEVCGVRLLRWTLGDSAQIDLPVTADKVADNKKWLQVVLDPEKDRRAWIEFTAGRSNLMRVVRLADWVTGGKHARIRAKDARNLVLRAAPSQEREIVPYRLKLGGEDLTVEVRGFQGDWARVELQSEACLRARDAAGGDEVAACPSGWTLWRDYDGTPLMFPW